MTSRPCSPSALHRRPPMTALDRPVPATTSLPPAPTGRSRGPPRRRYQRNDVNLPALAYIQQLPAYETSTPINFSFLLLLTLQRRRCTDGCRHGYLTLGKNNPRRVLTNKRSLEQRAPVPGASLEQIVVDFHLQWESCTEQYYTVLLKVTSV